MVNGKECYVVQDKPNLNQPGVTWNGPLANIMPVTEYEQFVDIAKINDYTYVNVITFSNIVTESKGTILYYSVIGVDQSNNTITHLSTIREILLPIDLEKDIQCEIFCTKDLTSIEDNDWERVGVAPWGNDIIIGDITDVSSISKYGIPFPKNVPIFTEDEIKYSTKYLATYNYITVDIPNVWQKNNTRFNYRKLKSFKIRNVSNDFIGDFSEPTFQSLLPVSIEKMTILQMYCDKMGNSHIPFEYSPDTPELGKEIGFKRYSIIRRDGVYYNTKEHSHLGLNKYNIPLEEDIAIFSENSTEDYITKQIQAAPGIPFRLTFYLQDVYGNISPPTTIIFKI